MKKVTITLHDDQAKAIEQIRKKRRLPRSRVIQQAIAYYLAEQSMSAAIRRYEEGYRRIPENAAEAETYEKMAAAVLTEEDWE